MINPYENDHQSQQIGQLIIENQTDKVIIYGDIEITKTETGLAEAKQLQQLLNSIVDTLERTKSSDPESFLRAAAKPEDIKPKVVKNPFT